MSTNEGTTSTISKEDKVDNCESKPTIVKDCDEDNLLTLGILSYILSNGR